MTDAILINSTAYWDGRFVENWEGCQGPAQSRFFARLAIEHLPRWLVDQIRRESLTVCDWGCAQGDGTDVWAGYMDARRLTGVDFSSVAIEQAARRYPAIRFVSEDWLTQSSNVDQTFDLVFSSNTLEHFHEPYEVLDALCRRARKGLILALPYREMERIDEHFFTFLSANIPLVLRNGFRLMWSQVVDCRSIPGTLWDGDQILLVFADPGWVDLLGLTLRDGLVSQEDSAAELVQLSAVLAERDGQIASLNRALAERDGQLAGLNQVLAERDGQLADLNQALEEADACRAHAVKSHEQTERLLTLVLGSHSWRLTKPLRFAGRLVRHRGISPNDRRRFIDQLRHIGHAAPTTDSIRRGFRRILDGLLQPYVGSPACVLMLLENFSLAGGVERVVIDLCLALGVHGRSCKILVAGSGGRGAAEARSHGIEVIEFNQDKTAFMQYLGAHRHAVLLTHHCYFCLEVIHEARIPVIEVIHNAYYWQKNDTHFTSLRSSYVSAFVAVSSFVKNYTTLHLGVAENNIHLINNGLKIDGLIRPPLELIKKRRLASVYAPRIVHVANLYLQKSHRLVVRAFARVRERHPSATLAIAGAMDAHAELRTLLLEDIAQLGLSDAVQLKGPLDRRSLSQLLATSHVALLPSQFEGFSIVTLEFSFFALPSVLSATGAATELQQRYGHVVIAPGCAIPAENLSFETIEDYVFQPPAQAVEALSASIFSVLEDYPVWLDKAISAAVDFPAYSFEHTASQYESLIRSCESA